MSKETKSFRIDLPGGRKPTRSGYIVIVASIVLMVFTIFTTDVDSFTLEENSWIVRIGFLCVGLTSIVIGKLILKLLHIPFSEEKDT